MSSQEAVHIETDKLVEALGEIDGQLSEIGPRYYGDNVVEQALDAQREEKRRRLELLAGEPYFGRIDFQEALAARTMALYIGKRGMERRGEADPYIIDWRAPVASLFYTFTGGEAPVTYTAPDGDISGEVLLKRNLSIRDRMLQRVVDSYARGGDNLGLSDEFLLYRLGENKDNRLRDIVSTIQAEQDNIIRAPRAVALIIQGSAGSGKTTVALHRLAYLLYHYQDQVRAERMIIFAPNAMFLDYISGVLPELGVGNVAQTTFSQWAIAYMGKAVKVSTAMLDEGEWFAIGADEQGDIAYSRQRYKGSLAFKAWIDSKLSQYEQQYLPPLSFEAWEGCVLEEAEIREWHEVEHASFPFAERRERLAARMKRWLEIRLKEVRDDKRRQDLGKKAKQKLKTFLKKLPEPDSYAFYQSLFAGKQELGGDNADGVPQQWALFTRKYLVKGQAAPEDLPALVWIHIHFHGQAGPMFDHVVIDEAQDISSFQLALLRACMREPSFTVLGDLAQGIHAYKGVHRWEELGAALPAGEVAYAELQQSYRSTLEIIAFANRLIPFTGTGLPPAQPVFRSGDPVQLKHWGEVQALDELGGLIKQYSEDGMRTIAIIGRTAADCAHWHEQLAAYGVAANLIFEGQQQYKGGLSVVPVYLSKGLEFDAVIIADADRQRYALNEMNAKLLYVACTRALHKLALFTRDEFSPLLDSAE